MTIIPINKETTCFISIKILIKPGQKTVICSFDNNEENENIIIHKNIREKESCEKFYNIYLLTDSKHYTYGFGENESFLIFPDNKIRNLVPVIDPYGFKQKFALYFINHYINLLRCKIKLSNIHPDIGTISIMVYD